MIKTVSPAPLGGTIPAIASKSMAHRLMVCAALAREKTTVHCSTTSLDMEATAKCLAAMEQGKPMPCGESGSTLRFLLPVAAALGKETTFLMEGRLPRRPLGELEEQLRSHGVTLRRPETACLEISGQLRAGAYTLPGNVSSQYISGLLLALPLLDAPSTLTVTGKVESAAYIEMTLSAMKMFGVTVRKEENTYFITPQTYCGPVEVAVEGDWSNAAFWLCAGALGRPMTVTGLNTDSLQGDRAVTEILARFGAKVNAEGDRVTVSPAPLTACDIDAAEIPDLVPVLSVAAAAAKGTSRIYNAGRLRLKESDRLQTVCEMLTALGADISQTEDGLVIRGGKALRGGETDSFNDHRIAMSAAVAAVLCQNPVTVTGAEAVNKSYPQFWEHLELLK